MTVLRLFRQALAASWQQITLLAVLSGLANAGVLAIINWAARSLADHDTLAQGLVILGLAIAIYSLAQRALMVRSASLAESTVARLRAGLVGHLEQADLSDVERLDRGRIYTALSAEMQVISDGTLGLIVVGQALILVVLTTLYLAWLSFTAVLLASLFIGIGTTIHLARSKEIAALLRKAFMLEGELVQAFTDFVEGFKEVKLNTARSGELVNHIRSLSVGVAERRIRMRDLYATNFVASQVAFFSLTGAMVFLVPAISTVDPRTVVEITASVLFIIGPISTVIGGLPVLQRVNAAAESVLSLQGELQAIAQGERGDPDPARLEGFERITLAGVTYAYPDSRGEKGFSIGPIDLEIARGSILFITGGNGCGKSTLLKVLTGLYAPSTGTVRLDSQAITDDSLVAYRNLFCAIFADNHLFKTLYGLPETDPAEAEHLVKFLELDGKVKIENRSFSTINLSSGQKKRLAMIAALLEDRPIYVFDEWAADQDPYFRARFYKEILPWIREKGKTVIAVTHDDRYFDAADHRVSLEEGQLYLAPDPVSTAG